MVISRRILFRMRNVSDKSCIENKTHILYSVTFFQKSCRLWDNVEKYGRARQATDDNIIWRMRFACFINKATDTHAHTLRICDTYCFCTTTVVARTRLNIMLYVQCLCCLNWAPTASPQLISNSHRSCNWSEFSQLSSTTDTFLLSSYVNIHLQQINLPWIWRQYVPPKRRRDQFFTRRENKKKQP
jgi:hypothetical protein